MQRIAGRDIEMALLKVRSAQQAKELTDLKILHKELVDFLNNIDILSDKKTLRRKIILLKRMLHPTIRQNH